MRRIQWYGPALVLLATTLVVMLTGPKIARQIAWARADAEITLIRDSLVDSPSLAEMSNAFRKVARAVEPSVVHIQVSTKETTRSGRREFLEDELFRRFFGPRGHQPDDGREDGEGEGEDGAFDRYNVPRAFGSGSGWVYDGQGHIVTNFHVIDGADLITVRFHDGTEREAEVLGVDPKTDIAVIRVEGDSLHPATLAEEAVEQGDIVLAFGSPFRFDFSVSQGIVSAKGRRLGILDNRQGYEDFIQTDAAINPGNSGGPLTNIYGQVVGMNTAIATRSGGNQGLGFAIPIAMVEGIVEQLIATGKVSRGYLGIYIADLDPKLARTFGFDGEGVLVETPIEGGPAEDSGIRRGDIVTHVDGQKVTSADELRQMVALLHPGTKVDIDLYRDGETVQTEITIGELPDQVAVAGAGGDSSGTDNDGSQRVLRMLGLEAVTDFTEDLAERLGIEFTPGVIVRSVRAQSAAAAAGIGKRHVITDVMGVGVGSVDELVAQLEEHDLSRGVRVSITDGKVRRFALLELSEE